MPQSSVQNVQEDEGSGEAAAGSVTGGQGGGLYESEAPWAVCHTVSMLSPVTLTCVNYIFFPYKYWIWFTHFHYIFTTCCWYKKNSHNGDFTLVLLKIFDVHLVFCRFLKTYFSTILQFCGRSPVKSTKGRSLIFLPRIPYSTVSAMMLFKHDSFYTKIFIDDWSCYNIWKNVNNSS